MAVDALQEYVYPKLAKGCENGCQSIRLMKVMSRPQEPVRISLREVDLSRRPRYRCLSYTWGDPLDRSLSSSNDSLLMSSERDKYVKNEEDGSVIRVTENLLDALHQISRIQESKAEGQVSSWWIDAICIDQEDAEERSSQVSVMDIIYQRAVGVLIWLGKEDRRTPGAIKIMKSLARVSPDLTKMSRRFRSFNTDSSEIFDSLSRLCEDLGIEGVCPQDLLPYAMFLQRKWFTRMWVIQESFFSAATTVFCGEREIQWTTMQESSRVLAQTGMDTLLKAYVSNMEHYSLDVDTVKLPDNRLGNQLIFGSLQRANGETIGLGRLLYYSRSFEASDPRDKVFAILGLWRYTRNNRAGQMDIRPDYHKDVSEVYVEATTVAIHESGNLDILSLVDGTRREGTSRLPSWVPDYSQGSQLYSIIPFSPPHPSQLLLHASFKAPTDTQTRDLAVQGLEMDVVEDIGPTYSDIVNDFGLWSLLNLLLTYPQMHYPTGESPCGAFLRTLIKDTFRGSQAGIEGRLAFPTFVMQRIRETRQYIESLEDLEEHDIAEEVKAILQETERIIESLSSRYSEEKAIPTLREIEEMVYIEEEEEGSLAEQKLESDRKDIEESFRIAYFKRRLFRTAQGYFGIASQSIVPGDRVWVLAGARVPFVLKAADIEDESRWELVSEAYVHGVMHGNASRSSEEFLRRISL
ncbi:HET-domain-containing protein, partial [Nemania sp. FL0031]